MESGREEAVVYCCALCDTYFIIVVGRVKLAEYRGKKVHTRVIVEFNALFLDVDGADYY